jgi:hypothetical protein
MAESGTVGGNAKKNKRTYWTDSDKAILVTIVKETAGGRVSQK